MIYYLVCIMVGIMLGVICCCLLIKLAPKKWFEDIIDEDDY